MQVEQDHAPDLEVLGGHRNGSHLWVIREQKDRLLHLHQPLDHKAAVEGGNNNIVLLCLQATVDDKNISILNPNAAHGVAFDAGAIDPRLVETQDRVNVPGAHKRGKTRSCLGMQRVDAAQDDAPHMQRLMREDGESRLAGIEEILWHEKRHAVGAQQAAHPDGPVDLGDDQIAVGRRKRGGDDEQIPAHDPGGAEGRGLHGVGEAAFSTEAQQAAEIERGLAKFFAWRGEAREDVGRVRLVHRSGDDRRRSCIGMPITPFLQAYGSAEPPTRATRRFSRAENRKLL